MKIKFYEILYKIKIHRGFVILVPTTRVLDTSAPTTSAPIEHVGPFWKKTLRLRVCGASASTTSDFSHFTEQNQYYVAEDKLKIIIEGSAAQYQNKSRI